MIQTLRRKARGGYHLVCIAVIGVIATRPAGGADWPSAHTGDGVAESEIVLPLRLAWMVEAVQPPSPAFRGQLPEHQWHNTRLPMVEALTYDWVFHPAVADGRVFFGSSAEECVVCLDAATGAEQWRFFVDGPVRFPPSCWGGQVYVGSDDGRVYCLSAAEGTLKWAYTAAPGPRRCVGNGRVISAWPVRTQIAVAPDAERVGEAVVYFGCGLFPPQGTWIVALDAASGEEIWRRDAGLSMHGQVLVTDETILVGTGRTAPAEFRRDDGVSTLSAMGSELRRTMGSPILRLVNGCATWGPSEGGTLFARVSMDPPPKTGLQARRIMPGTVTGLHGLAMVGGDRLYVVRRDAVVALPKDILQTTLDTVYKHASTSSPYGGSGGGRYAVEQKPVTARIDSARVWSVPNEQEWSSIIRTGGTLFVGGKDNVSAISTEDGKVQGSHKVEGLALGLAAADGALYVSTDSGRIYCFRADAAGSPPVRRPAPPSPPPPPDDADTRALLRLVSERADVDQGFVFVLGAGDGRLARALAEATKFSVVVVERDADAVARVRQALSEAGVYGQRLVVRHAPNPELDFAFGLGNVVIVNSGVAAADAWAGYDPASVRSLVQPYGGLLIAPGRLRDDAGQFEWTQAAVAGTQWALGRRGDLPGAGAWTHIYAGPGNTVCSGDELVDTDQVVQWFGPPGPKDMVARHHVPHPPLSEKGKLFVAGKAHAVMAIDAYNGANLWTTDVPRSTRTMASHQTGMMAAQGDRLFVASGAECWMLEANTGARERVFSGPMSQCDWGCVVVAGDLLLGSSQPTAALDASQGASRELVYAGRWHSRPTISRDLFALRYGDGLHAWRYHGPSVILNPTITVGDGRVYFAESRNPDAERGQPAGSTDLPDFFAADAHLVALDLATGREVWRRPLRKLSDHPKDEHEHIMFLSYSDGLLLSTRTGHMHKLNYVPPQRKAFSQVYEGPDGPGTLTYELKTYDAATGEPRWTQYIASEYQRVSPLSYGKNMQQAHPAIADGRIYLLAWTFGTFFSFDLQTGAPDHNTEFGRQWEVKGCAVPTASSKLLFYRYTLCSYYDPATRSSADMTGVVRPSCYMSMIPAGGLILMPDGSAVCTCGIPLQMSMALAPAALK